MRYQILWGQPFCFGAMKHHQEDIFVGRSHLQKLSQDSIKLAWIKKKEEGAHPAILFQYFILGPVFTPNRENEYDLVIKDYFTKWAEAILLPDMETYTIAWSFLDKYVTKYVRRTWNSAYWKRTPVQIKIFFFLKTGLIVNRTHTMMKPNQMFRKKLLFRIKTFFIYRMKRNHYQILFLGFISYLFNIYMTYICTRTNRNCINFF